jgi:translation initiation factor IF-2
MIKVEEKEVHLGTMKVLAVFYKKEKDMIIWGKITEGVARNGALFRILRGEEIIGTGKITSLKKEQENVDEISQWYECGLKVRVSKKIVENDILDFYVME